jgi:tetratricopeptide (TPR) repeat protein
MIRPGWVWSVVAIVGVGAAAFTWWRIGGPGRGDRATGRASARAEYIGSGRCAGCHVNEIASWQRSQHAAAMTEASDATVLGNFDDARLTVQGVASTFFRRDGKFLVRTQGADGRAADFEIANTFGLFPLQQYLIEFPGGRRQALTLAWDTRPAAQGGQRWFSLYPRERIEPGDPLHWTGREQNWNFMCADCHSTNLRKGYDPSTRTFHTTSSEISVGCEACHGPGSVHVDQAERGALSAASGYGLTVSLDERKGASWRFDPAVNRPVRSIPRQTEREIEVCARCHARRAQVTDQAIAGDRLNDDFRPSLLEPSLFYPDGQQRDEVYTYASFLQSRMYAEGVTCSDCHDPHSGRPRLEGNALCTRCHAPDRYDVSAHTGHDAGTAAAACATCHMPTATYMQIDRRHDHSFRVPRPDLTVALGVPNACTSSCHADRGAAWAAAALARRGGGAPGGFQQFARAFAAADASGPGSAAGLAAVAADRAESAIARASALERLANAGSLDGRVPIPFLDDPSPLVRRAALSVLAHAPDAVRLDAMPRLLRDPIRTVRTEAVRGLADLADRSLSASYRADFDRAFDEFLAEQQFNADRPEAQVNLGIVWGARGRMAEATAAFREAIALDGTFVPAYVNLADLHRAAGDDASAETTLRDAIRANPASAPAHFALGLTLVRRKQLAPALDELARAAQLDPSIARYGYVHGVALHDAGRAPQAVTALEAVVAAHPDDRDSRFALAMYDAELGRLADARRHAEQLVTRHPGDAGALALLARLGAQ